MPVTPLLVTLDANVAPPVGPQPYGPYFTAVNDERYIVLVRNPDQPFTPFGGGTWDGDSGGVPDLGTPTCTVYKSTDAGQTWNPIDTGNSPLLPPQNHTETPLPGTNFTPVVTFGFTTFSVVQHGTILYVALPSWDFITYLTLAPHPLYIARFDTSTDTWIANLTEPSDGAAPILPQAIDYPLVANPDGFYAPFYCTVCFYMQRRSTDGSLIVIFQQKRTDGTIAEQNNEMYYVTCSSAGTWGAPVLVLGDVDTDYRPCGLVEGDSGVMHLVAEKWTCNDGTGSDPFTVSLIHVALSSSNALGSAQEITVISTDIDVFLEIIPYIQPPAAVDASGTTQILIAYVSAVSDGIGGFTVGLKAARGDSGMSPAWSLETIVADGDPEIQQQLLSYKAFNIPLVASGSEITAITGSTDTTDIYSFSGAGSWGAATLLFSAIDFVTGASGTQSSFWGIFGGVCSTNKTDITIFSDVLSVQVDSGSQFFGENGIFYFEYPVSPAPPVVVTVPPVGVSGITNPGQNPLNMVGPIVRDYLATNKYDCCLRDEVKLYRSVNFDPPRCPIPSGQEFKAWLLDGEEPPYDEQSAQCIPFKKFGVTPARDNTPVLVMTLRVPLGYNGVIRSLVCMFTGRGFIDGSGDILWRLQINRRWLKDYGNVKTALGSLIEPSPTQVYLVSGQKVSWYVQVPNNSGQLQDGNIICAVNGWFYPMQEQGVMGSGGRLAAGW